MGSTGVSSDKEEDGAGKYHHHVFSITWVRDRFAIMNDVSIKIIQHCINVVQKQVFESCFHASGSPEVQRKAQNSGANAAMELVRHFAVSERICHYQLLCQWLR